MANKIYLGDGVYMSMGDNMIRLETHRPFGREVNDVIYLEKAMVYDLIAYLKKHEDNAPSVEQASVLGKHETDT